MRRITTGLLLTVTVLVLLFSYHTSTEGSSTVASAAGAASVVAGTQTAPSLPESSRTAAAPPGPPNPHAAPSTTVPANLQIDGAVEETRRGPVQVRVTFQGTRILEVAAIVLPTGNERDTQINDYAVPILHRESVEAQNANINMVSGATLTSEGYQASLQSAIDLVRGQR